MSEACYENSFEGFKDFSVTLRDIKGYNGEVFVKNCLDKLNVSYVSNPLDSIQLWKQFQAQGADFRIKSLNMELEVKNIDGKVFRSWIIRDWLPRFSYKHEKRIVAIPITTKLPTISLETLFTYDVYIVYYDSIKYIIDRANKLSGSSKRKSGISEVKNYSLDSASEFKVKPIDSTSRFDRLVLACKDNRETDKNDSKNSGEYRNSTDDAKPESKYIQANLDEYLDLEQKPMQNCSPNGCTTEELKLYCRTCTRYQHCDLYLEYLKFMERHKNLIETLKRGERSIKMLKKNYQICLFDDASEKRRELKDRIEEMNREFKALRDKIFKCIERRRYCHINLGYACFRRRMR